MKLFRNLEFVLIMIVFISFITSSFAEDTLTINSPSYFNEEEKIYEDIHYLENEILSFDFCTDNPATNIKIELACNIGDNVQLEYFENKNKENCFFSNYALDKLDCKDFALEVDYTTNKKNRKFKRTFKQEKQSKLINHVLNLDPELLNPVDLSYYLVVLNNIETSQGQRSVEAYDKLKNDRNNNDKCWPKEECDIQETTKILRNLNLAGYDVNSRLLDDGKTYLEKSKISNENNPTAFSITISNSFLSNESTICALEIDSENPKNYLFDSTTKNITKYASSSIELTCDQSIELITLKLLTTDGTTKEIITSENSNSIEKTLQPFSCIGITSCDYSSTINTLIAFSTNFDSSNLLVEYIKSLIINDGETSYLNTNNIYENTGKYLHYQKDDGLTEYLKFKQNNQGSWGLESMYDIIIKTSWAVMGLQKVIPESEYVIDGKKWIYFNEPESGWGNIEKNTLAYLAIKEQIKPYLKISTVNEISEKTKISIENPTIHNLKNIKIKLNDEINNYVSYTENLGDLNGDEKIDFEILVNPDFYSVKSGTLTLTGVDGKNNELTLLELPINLKGPTPIKLIGGNYSITPEVPIIYLRIQKNIPEYSLTCTYQNPFDQTSNTISLSSTDYEIPIHNAGQKEGNFDIELNCAFGDINFNTMAQISVTVAQKSFTTIDELTLTSTDDFSFQINDTSGERQTLRFEIDGHYNGLIEPAEESKLLAIDDSRDLYFEISNPILLEAYGNSSVGNIIIKSTSGYMKKIPVHLDLNQTEKKPLSIGMIILIIFLTGFILLVLFRFYELRKHKKENEQTNENEEFYFE